MDIVQTAVVLAFGLALASKLDELIDKRPDFKNDVVSKILNFPNAKYSYIIKSSNQIFLRLFNILYEGKKIIINILIWEGIFISFSIIFLFGLLLQLGKIVIPLENLLTCILIVATASSILPIILIIILSKSKISDKSKVFRYFLLSIIFLTIGFVWFLLDNFAWFIPQVVRLNKTLLILVITTSIFIGRILSYFVLKKKPDLYNISPPRVIFSSIFAITTITLLNENIIISFIYDFNQIGIILFAYLILNILADSISLWETNIVLRLAAKGNIKRFVALGLFDIFLSAIIFLAIPLYTGNLDVFLDAMWFKGEHPWLGVLFWSTFSTSIIFWLFLLSVFVLTILQKILKYYVKLNVALPIDKKPITCLYVTAVVFIIPFVFVIF